MATLGRSHLPLLAVALAVLALTAACDNGNSPSTASPIAGAFSPAAGSLAPSPAPAPSGIAESTPPSIPAAGEQRINGIKALQHVSALAGDIGSRSAGTEAEGAAAQYIAQQLRGYGYEVAVQDFQFQGMDRVASLQSIAPMATPIKSLALVNSADGEVSGQLVPAGLGRPEDISKETVSGRIALLERGLITFESKAANASLAGARAVVIYNNEPGIFEGVLLSASDIPVIAVSGQDGQELLMLASSSSVEVRLSVSAPEAHLTSRNVIARAGRGPCRVLVGGHYDSVPVAPGANDNASGAAVMLEVARASALDGLDPGACFAAFGAEEIGLIGSMHLANSLSPEERVAMNAMVNLDVVGAGASWRLIGSRELVDIALAIARNLAIEASAGSLPPGTGSDHQSFLSVGIPVVFLTMFGGPPIHTPSDDVGTIEADRLEQAGRIAIALLSDLLSAVN